MIRTALVPHSAADMFALVDDIEAYAEFLPWCSRSEVLARDEHGVHGLIELRKGAVHKSFTTHNINVPGTSIDMHLIDGPFNHLEGIWRFDALSETACKVTLDLEYEFSSTLLKMTVGPIFRHVADSLVDAFCQRAAEVYGS